MNTKTLFFLLCLLACTFTGFSQTLEVKPSDPNAKLTYVQKGPDIKAAIKGKWNLKSISVKDLLANVVFEAVTAKTPDGKKQAAAPLALKIIP